MSSDITVNDVMRSYRRLLEKNKKIKNNIKNSFCPTFTGRRFFEAPVPSLAQGVYRRKAKRIKRK